MIDLGAVSNDEIEINEIKKSKNQRKEFENFQLYLSGKLPKPTHGQMPLRNVSNFLGSVMSEYVYEWYLTCTVTRCQNYNLGF